MYLHRLTDTEKFAFLELAHFVAKIDGRVAEAEINYLNKYRAEMNTPDYKIRGLELNSIMSCFESKEAKTLVLIEILGLVNADGSYEVTERDLVNEICKAFGIGVEKCTRILKWLGQLKDLYSEGEDIINE